MAGQPEPLRLFDVDGDADPRLSHDETTAVSIRDTNVPIRDTVLVDGSTRPPHGADGLMLQRVARAAAGVVIAGHVLNEAIAAARSDGCSWRAIGAATGLPYQTLHRRAARRC
jgi:hypothetical protein